MEEVEVIEYYNEDGILIRQRINGKYYSMSFQNLASVKMIKTMTLKEWNKKFMTKVKNGEWVQPTRKGYKMQCCDCGLVHIIDFRLIKIGNFTKILNFIILTPHPYYIIIK